MDLVLPVARRTVHNGRQRRRYVVGANKGELRLSRVARRRLPESGPKKGEMTSADSEAMEELIRQMAAEELDDGTDVEAEAEEELDIERTGEQSGWLFRLGRGSREVKTGQTQFEIEDEGAMSGKWIRLEVEEVSSGQRWFREPYPLEWVNGLSGKEREEKSRRSYESYGKEYVEVEGRWYEVEQKVGAQIG